MELLIQNNVNLDQGKSDDGTTATFIAAQDGRHEVVQMLAAAGYAVCCVQCAVCCVLCAVCCVLCALCCVLCAVCGVLCSNCT